MKKHIQYIVIGLLFINSAGITATAYFTFMNKARIQAAQRVLVDTQYSLSSTVEFMDEMADAKKKLEEQKKPLMAGIKAPDFTLKNENNEEVSLASFSGKKTLFVFSQPGCGYCEQFYPELKRFTEESSEVQVAIMQLHAGVEENKVIKEEKGLEIPFLATSNEVMTAYKVRGTPTSILIDEEGRVLGTQNVTTLEDLNTFINTAGNVAMAK